MDLICKVRSVVWRLIVHGYPSRWSKMRFFRPYAGFNLDTFFTKTNVLLWIEQAKTFAAAQGVVESDLYTILIYLDATAHCH